MRAKRALRRALCRALWAAPLLAGCLSPGDPYLPVRDAVPPTVKATFPTASQVIPLDSALQVTFSEVMDASSLAPGLGLLKGQQEVTIAVSLPALREGEAEVERGDVPYKVSIGPSGGGAWEPSTGYVLVLRTLLTDVEGNPLAEERAIPFLTVP